MRRLLLLRHAKSSWADPGVRDHDRPLNARGRKAAAAVGAYLRDHALVPELVLCSPAVRTCETLARLDLPGSVAVRVEADLYLAHPDAVLDLIHAVDDAVTALMVVGHNPTTHEVALDLAGHGDPDALRNLAAQYPTGALAVLDHTGPWAELAPGSARLERFVVPRSLVDD